MQPETALINNADGGLYLYFVKFIQKSVANHAGFFGVVSILLFYIQALIIAGLVMKLKLFAKPNYLVGAFYILVTSFSPLWSLFSSALVANTFLIGIWYLVSQLQQTSNPKTVLFHIGLLLSLCNLFFAFSFIFILLVIVGLLTYRPFKLNEYAVVLLGFVLPIYCWAVFDFLRDSFHIKNYLLVWSMKLPIIPLNKWLFFSISALALLLLAGILYVQNQSVRMAIHARRSWSIIFFWLLIAFVVPFFASDVHYWVLCLLPIAFFAATPFYFMSRIRIRGWLHWALFAWAVFMMYFHNKW